jgi:amino-acid N-acetyltransferase
MKNGVGLMETIIRCAQTEDMTRLELFLEEAGLSTDGVRASIDYFLVIENQAREMKATLGIEPLGKVGLLRSLAIRPDLTEKDLFLLFEQIFILARDRQLTTLYLASNKKSSLEVFRLIGFTEEIIENLPAELFQSEHVKHILTVDNSFFLKLSI